MTKPDEWFESVPVLKGWINLTEAAERIGVSPQHISRLAHKGFFKTIHRVGDKKMLVVSEAEVEKKTSERKKQLELEAETS